MANTFGQNIGNLVRQKRNALGLTQNQLSEDAFGSSSKVARISELESGKVSRPHQKTIDPIISVLRISQAEIDKCALDAVSNPDPVLIEAFSEAEELLRKIAEEYDAFFPDASLQELNDFLLAKAQEYYELKAKIEALLTHDVIDDDFKDKVYLSLNNGDFEDVDKLLEVAEDRFQTDHTMECLRQQSALRITRGDSKFLQGDLNASYKHYEFAALIFKPFDELIMAITFSELARRIYESGRRSLSMPIWVSRDLICKAIEELSDQCDKAFLAELNYNLSLILRNYCAEQEEDEVERTLRMGINAAREAIQICDECDDVDGKIKSQISLGNLLLDLSKIETSADTLDSAINVLSAVYSITKESESHEGILPYVANSLGGAIEQKLSKLGEEASTSELSYVRDLFAKAVSIAEKTYNTEIIGSASINLARSYFNQSKIFESSSQKADYLRKLVVSKLLTALEFLPLSQLTVHFAEAHFLLAETLYQQAIYSEVEISEVYFMRAIASYENSAQVFSHERNPDRWAYIQVKIGTVFANHAEYADDEGKIHDVKKAAEYLTNAMKVYEELDNQKMVQTCKKHLTTLETRHERTEAAV